MTIILANLSVSNSVKALQIPIDPTDAIVCSQNVFARSLVLRGEHARKGFISAMEAFCLVMIIASAKYKPRLIQPSNL